MRVLLIAALLAAAVAMPLDRADSQAELDAAAQEITELSGSALLEARAGLHTAVGANEAFDTAPYKFFLWNPTQPLTHNSGGHEVPLRTTQWGPRRTPQDIKQKLVAAITGAGLPGKCGDNDRCVLLGPEFLAHGSDRLTATEYGEYKRDLKALSATYRNILLAPGTVVYRTRGSTARCTQDARTVWPARPAIAPARKNEQSWYDTEATWRACTYNFNVLVVAFRDAILIEHYKRNDGGTALGSAFDLTARPDLPAVTPQSRFTVAAWGNAVVGVEICSDHFLHRVKAATHDTADLQLSPFYPGSISASSIAMTGVKDGGFVVQNGGQSVSNRVFKRSGQTLTQFYRPPPNHPAGAYVPQVGVARGLDVYEYIGVPQPQQPNAPNAPGNGQQPPVPPRRLARSNSVGALPRGGGGAPQQSSPQQQRPSSPRGGSSVPNSPRPPLTRTTSQQTIKRK